MALGWGIVGPGRIADLAIAPAISQAVDGHLQAVVSRDQSRAEAFADRHGAARALASYEEMLADPEVDVVYVGTPNAQHAEQTIAALRAGKHVLCDKPLATTVFEAERMVAAARETGRKLGTGYQMRHHAANREARRIVESGAIGDPLVIQVETSTDRLPAAWRTDPALAGAGALYNLGVHGLDLLRFLTGAEVIEVVALNDCQPGDWLDLATLMLCKLSNGALASVNCNHKTPDFQPDITIYGSKGRIVGRQALRSLVDGELRVKIGEQEVVRPYSSRDAFVRMVEAFNRAVAEDREPDASGLDGLRGVQVAEAVIRSVRDGGRVRLEI
jgi:1,5-anhydro-D-fructose reductase (1,5-anhydro-D-mannitol-forming)